MNQKKNRTRTGNNHKDPNKVFNRNKKSIRPQKSVARNQLNVVSGQKSNRFINYKTNKSIRKSS